jgi:hypothetical protein
MRPLATLLYGHALGPDIDLDWRHGYIISYSDPAGAHAQRTRLNRHTDDSELTLSVCLGCAFTGGEVVVSGRRTGAGGKAAAVEQLAAVAPTVGRALVHLGTQLHEVRPVDQGERHMLILWCRSSAFRAKHCPCCTIMQRGDQCVCHPEWRSR